MADLVAFRGILRVSRAIVVQRPPRPDDPERVKRRRELTAKEFGLTEHRSITEIM